MDEYEIKDPKSNQQILSVQIKSESRNRNKIWT